MKQKQTGLACRQAGLACRQAGLACRQTGLACRQTGLACRQAGLACRQAGFTVIELLVVLAIFLILMLIFFSPLSSSFKKAQDGRTKKNLFELKVAFEEYHNDNHCYPPADWFDAKDDCNTDQLAPYLNKIKCNPSTNLPYIIEYDASGCDWFKIYTDLHYPDESLYVHDGTGVDNYNYGVSSSNTIIKINTSPSPNPSPSPSIPPTNNYYCQTINNCTSFNSELWSCTPSYTTTNCDAECSFSVSNCTPN